LLYTNNLAKKIQASGLIINLIILLILSIGYFSDRPEFVDIVLVFLLLNLVGLVGFLRLLKHGSLGLMSYELMERKKDSD